MATMARNMDRQVNRTLITAEDKTRRWPASLTSTDYAAFGDADLVIEAATEKEDDQARGLQGADAAPEAVLHAGVQHVVDLDHPAGRGTDRPEKFIGMHFMNPVPVMKLVEIIRGIATDEPTFQAVQALAAEAGQDQRGGRGFSGLHRQPHPGADDQRGGLRAV